MAKHIDVGDHAMCVEHEVCRDEVLKRIYWTFTDGVGRSVLALHLGTDEPTYDSIDKLSPESVSAVLTTLDPRDLSQHNRVALPVELMKWLYAAAKNPEWALSFIETIFKVNPDELSHMGSTILHDEFRSCTSEHTIGHSN